MHIVEYVGVRECARREGEFQKSKMGCSSGLEQLIKIIKNNNIFLFYRCVFQLTSELGLR